MEVLVDEALCHEVADAFFVEAIGKDAVFVHQIGHEDEPAGFRHSSGFVQCLEFFLIADEMIERTEQERGVGHSRRQKGHVAGIALHDVGCGFAFQEDLDVAAHEFHGFDPKALAHQGRSIAPRSRTDVEQEGAGGEMAAEMMHGGFKLDDAMTTLEAQVFGVFVVVFLYVG